MSTITNDFMLEMLSKCRPYTVVILRKTPQYDGSVIDKIVWEHGRRNSELKREGKISVVCPVRDRSDIGGVGIFSTDAAETRRLMDGDPAVMAGILTYEIHATVSFPGSMLSG
jgi:hypothetical protein